MSWLVRRRFPRVPGVSVEALHGRGTPPAGLLLLDARTAEEFVVSHLPGAAHAPDADTALRLVRAHAAPAPPVVVYCSVGWRSAALADRLLAAGLDDVCNLQGSIFDWANKGLPVVRDGEPVQEVHPFDRVGGLLLRPELRARAPRSAGAD